MDSCPDVVWFASRSDSESPLQTLGAAGLNVAETEVSPQSLAQADDAKLAAILRESTSPCIGLIDSSITRAEASQLLKLTLARSDVLLIEAPGDPTWRQDLHRGGRLELPAWLTTILFPPQNLVGWAFHRDVYGRVGPLDRKAGQPLWEWLIRATKVGVSVHRVAIESSRESLPGLPRLVPSRPGPRGDWLLRHLKAFDFAEAGLDQVPEVALTACRAGLFQWHDYLDESHQLSQSIEGEGEGQLGDYWHAIMHRREPDYANAKYWFRAIGRQANYPQLARAAARILSRCDADAQEWGHRLQPKGEWDPFAFVDFCEKCAGDEETELALAARRIQHAEMLLLISSTCEQLQQR